MRHASLSTPILNLKKPIIASHIPLNRTTQLFPAVFHPPASILLHLPTQLIPKLIPKRLPKLDFRLLNITRRRKKILCTAFPYEKRRQLHPQPFRQIPLAAPPSPWTRRFPSRLLRPAKRISHPRPDNEHRHRQQNHCRHPQYLQNHRRHPLPSLRQNTHLICLHNTLSISLATYE